MGGNDDQVDIKGKGPYVERHYRRRTKNNGLCYFDVVEKESDLYIGAERDLSNEAKGYLRHHRGLIDNYIRQHPHFLPALGPLPYDPYAPEIVREMLQCASLAGVGPMAGVAGAIAQYVARDLQKYSHEIIVENGGDIFVQARRPIDIAVFAGESPFTEKVVLRLNLQQMPCGVCTSSATVGPSLSFGRADAVCIVSPSATLADAVASAVGNRIQSPQDINAAIEFGRRIPFVTGVIVIMGSHLGVWGDVTLR